MIDQGSRATRHATSEPIAVKLLLTTIALVFLVFLLIAPLLAVFAGAFEKGWSAYTGAISQPDTLSAIRITLITAAFCVPLNLVFGLTASWAIAKFDFWGKSFLTALIDLPFAISPVISGLIFVLMFGARGVFGPWLAAHGIKIIFEIPGIILATTFVTFPFVAREVIPTMQAQGTEEELAAVSLGAKGWQVFTRVTLPNIRWALIYGVVLCNARAMGEFGAVSVVSSHIRGVSNTLPLHVELLFNDYDFAGAFAASSLLTLLALVTIIVKSAFEWWTERQPTA